MIQRLVAERVTLPATQLAPPLVHERLDSWIPRISTGPKQPGSKPMLGASWSIYECHLSHLLDLKMITFHPPPSVCTNQKLKLPLRWGICLCYSKSVNGKQPPTHYSTWMAASYSCAHATHVLQLGWISEEDIGYTARARKRTIALQTCLPSGLRLGFFTAPDSRRDASKSGCVALCRYLPPMRLKDYLLGCGQKRQKT